MGSASTKLSYDDSEVVCETDVEDSDDDSQETETSRENLDFDEIGDTVLSKCEVESELSKGEEVDRNDPLLIATVRARLNRVKKFKKVGQKTVTIDLKSEGPAEVRDGKEKELPGIVNPRRYQIEAFETAMTRNTILYLETGGGKTLVAVLLMKALARNLRLENDKRVAVFLVPTVLLVQQQAYVIEIHTDLKVGQYYGSRGVDNWSSKEWNTQIFENEVLVMTPQILLNNLQHGFFKMDMIELLIFDECHHAQKNHAYAQIMKGFYHTNLNNGRLPRIFGMTASPVAKKGVQSSIEAAGPLSALEGLLKSEVFTLTDREEVELVAPTPDTIEEYYSPHDTELVTSYKLKLGELLNKYEEANKHALSATKFEYKDQEDLINKLRKRIIKLHGDLQYCLEELGLWCAHKAAEHWMEGDMGDDDPEMFVDVAHSLKSNKDAFLKEAMLILQPAVPEEQRLQEAVKEGYLTSKVHQLVLVLSKNRFVQDVKCIIFVERIVAAVVLASLVNDLGYLSDFLRSEWISGANAGLNVTRVRQQSTMARFREGKVNLLVATNVAEEGIDVQSCSSVLRFDLPKTTRSFIQSRGRARRPGSTFIVLLERGNVAMMDQLRTLQKSEESMREEAVSRTNMKSVATLPSYVPLQTYRVDQTGASVNTETGMNLVSHYCGKLPGDKYYTPRPEYLVRVVGSTHLCTLKLPPTAPICQVIGQPQSSLRLAKQVTALEACKVLHQMGALNDHLVPTLDSKSEGEENSMKLKNMSGTGTTQQKELYPVAEALALTGNWHTSSNGALLYGYLISFDVQPSDEKSYANFVLLIKSELDDDVGNLETILFLTLGREAKTKLSPLGPINLTSRQMKDAMSFQGILFNGVYGKLTEPIKEARKRKRGSGISSMLLQMAGLWKSNNVYLLLPAVLNTCINGVDVFPIDWESIQVACRAIETLYHLEESDIEQPQPKRKLSFFKRLFLGEPHEIKAHESSLYVAGGRQVPASQLVDVSVLTIHTGKIYSVLGLCHEKTALCEFPKGKDGDKSEFKNYADFYEQKHGQTLQYPKQPLLDLKQAHRAHNLLGTGDGYSKVCVVAARRKRKFLKTVEVSRGETNTLGENRCTSQSVQEMDRTSEGMKTDASSVQMPPELCLVLGFPAGVIRSVYLIPSLMYRLKSAVLASQLRCSIRAPRIPVMKVLEALSTSRCNEAFNMEALELFGDSFLKYAVTKKLFLKLKTASEGILSAQRMHRICNKSLHQLAVKTGISAYIRDCQFDPSRWVAPGMSELKVVECHCKETQMYNPFIPTTSTVVALFGDEVTKDVTPVVAKERETQLETIKPRIGLTCDKGHRYLCSKTLADVMEALIGAYLVGKEYERAVDYMIWAGIDVECDPSLSVSATNWSLANLNHNYGMDIKKLEGRIGYTFINKGLLLEAMTHASNIGGDGILCYQRLEFLGDAVLDFLLTQHLFEAHPGLTPGLMTKLRSASVNNERYARVAVKHKLHTHLRHGSGLLFNQIEEFVKAIEAAGDDQMNSSYGLDGLQGPKVLGDVVESIAGAILVDTSFNVDAVWAVMKPLLSPIATPDTLMLHPICELEELCKRKGYHIHRSNTPGDKGQTTTITYKVKISEKETVKGTSCKSHKKAAQKDAAQKVLVDLETRGYRDICGSDIYRWKQKINANKTVLSVPTESKISNLDSQERMESIPDSQTKREEELEEIPLLKKVISVNLLDITKLSGSDGIAVVEPTIKTQVCNDISSVSASVLPDVGNRLSDKLHQPASEDAQGIEGTEVAPFRGIGAAHERLDRKSDMELIDSMMSGGGQVPDEAVQSPAYMACNSPKTPTGQEEQMKSATFKRKLEFREDDSNRVEKQAKYYWSREETVQSISTTSVTISENFETHASEEKVKSSISDPIDLINFCPWTGRNTPVSARPEVRVTSKEVPSAASFEWLETSKEVHSVSIQAKTTMKKECSVKASSLPSQSSKNVGKGGPENSRMVLNGLRMKNKWPSPAYNLVHELGMPHVRRFMYTLTVNTGVEKYESRGEPKMDKKQAQESAAVAMLEILKQKEMY